jgi:iron complex outermembrane receptor protein
VTSRQFNQDLFDVQQIEVLRGPQGALYGRDAIGGAILITSKQPTNTFTGEGEASAGNGDDYRAQAAVSGPIISDKLLFRLTGSYHHFGGLLEDTYLNKPVDYEDEYSVRAQLKAFITDRLTADVKASVDYVRGGANNFVYQGAKYDPTHPCFLDPSNPFGGPPSNANTVSRTFCDNNLGFNSRQIQDISVKLDYRLDFATITNVLAAAHIVEDLRGDQFPYTASRNVFGTDGTQTQWEATTAWSDDFRIASPTTQRFRWMAGGYFLATRRYISTTTGYDEGLGILNVERTPFGPDTTNPTLSFLADDNKNTAYAVYGNVSYDLTRQLEATLGYRYDQNDLNHFVEPISTSTLPTGCSAETAANCVVKRSFNQGQPKGTLNYKLDANVDLFTDYGIGFRTGQFNQSGAAEAANLPGVYDIVKPEVAYTYEAGVKTRWWDNKLRVNATFFETVDRNPAYFLFVGAVGAQILVNIDVGNQAPYIPVDSWQLAAQYRKPITNVLGLFMRVDVDHHGKQYWDPENATPRNAFELTNLHAGIESNDGKWSIVAYANNVFDKVYNAEFVSGGFAEPAEPRTFGVDLKYHF